MGCGAAVGAGGTVGGATTGCCGADVGADGTTGSMGAIGGAAAGCATLGAFVGAGAAATGALFWLVVVALVDDCARAAVGALVGAG